MARAKIRWSRNAFSDIRRSPGVVDALQGEVDKVLAKVGTEDYAGDVIDARTRARGGVVTTTVRAIRREAKEHTLLRALGGGS